MFFVWFSGCFHFRPDFTKQKQMWGKRGALALPDQVVHKIEPLVSGAHPWKKNKDLSLWVFPELLIILSEAVVFFHLVPFILSLNRIQWVKNKQTNKCPFNLHTSILYIYYYIYMYLHMYIYVYLYVYMCVYICVYILY